MVDLILALGLLAAIFGGFILGMDWVLNQNNSK
jgi:hypothetical protein